MAVGREGKPEMSRYLPKNTKTGDFNLRRTLSGSFFIIPERSFGVYCEQTNTIIYTSRDSLPSASSTAMVHR